MTDRLLSVSGLRKRFAIEHSVLGRPTRWLHAVNGVTFSLAARETLGLVGESGSGKSTVARLILGLIKADAGQVELDGKPVIGGAGPQLREMRRKAQMIFQDPYSSLDPTRQIGDSIAEPLVVHGGLSASGRRARVDDLLARVGLDPTMRNRYPHEFSGGQRQRIAIARALALRPRLIIADEAVSALDVSTQAHVLNLLMELREEHAMSYLFISHDLSVVRWLADRVAVLYLGQIVETGPAAEVCDAPLHPYSQALIRAAPKISADGTRRPAPPRGEIPDPSSPPPGCPFSPRCPLAVAACSSTVPALKPMGQGRSVACHVVNPM